MEEEAQASQINGDEFYETIEAPKFVDFTTPDHSLPDDRYWFCLRVGCDHKHEEELDSEAIYKNFVLRVMAARSPNIRLRKALNREPQSMKCPLTAPPKSSKSRLSRLALISSISKKIVDVKDRDRRPISKISATPKGNSKQSCAATAKALTTPRTRKQISNPDTFRSVRDPKDMKVAVPKNKLVAKALVFNSPKDMKVAVPKNKLVAKALVFNSPKKAVKVGKICAAMKKLEINADKKHHTEHNKPLPKNSTVKQKKGREVQSRVYDSFNPHIKKELEITGDNKHLMEHDKPLPLHCAVKQKRGREVKSRVFDSLKRNIKEKDLKSCDLEAHERIEIVTNDMKIKERSRSGLKEDCSASSPSKNGEVNGNEECLKATKTEHPGEVLSDSESGDNDPKFQATVERLKKTHDAADDNEEKVKSSSKKTSNSEDIDNDDKENTLVFGPEGNDQVMDSDDKENASASDDNRELKEGKDLSNHETPKKAQQVIRVTHNTLKKSSVSASIGPQYRKPKPTNPKPFRLRTDERGILKEANVEKKLQTPLKDITPVGLQGRKSMKKHQNAIHKNESCLRQNEHETCIFTTPQTFSVSMKHKASLVNSIKEESQFKVVKKCEDTLEKTKSPLTRKKLTRPQGCSSRKAMISNKKHGQLIVLKETSSTILRIAEAAKVCNNDVSSTNKASSSTKYRSVSRGKTLVTNPKEPNSHNIHVAKSFTRKMT